MGLMALDRLNAINKIENRVDSQSVSSSYSSYVPSATSYKDLIQTPSTSINQPSSSGNWLTNNIFKPIGNALANTGIQIGRTAEEGVNSIGSLLTGNFGEAAQRFGNTLGLGAGVAANFLTGDVWDDPLYAHSLKFNGPNATVYGNGMLTDDDDLDRTLDRFQISGINNVNAVTNKKHYLGGGGDVVQALLTTLGVKDITAIRAETTIEAAKNAGVTNLDYYAHSQGVRTAYGGMTLADKASLDIVNFKGMGGQMTIYENEFNLKSVMNYRIDDGGAKIDPIPLSQYLDPMNYTRKILYGSGNEVTNISSSTPNAFNASSLSPSRHDVLNYLPKVLP